MSEVIDRGVEGTEEEPFLEVVTPELNPEGREEIGPGEAGAR